MVTVDDVLGERRCVERGPGGVLAVGEGAELGGHDGGVETGAGARIAEGSAALTAVVEPVPLEDAGGGGVGSDEIAETTILHIDHEDSSITG